VVSVDGKEQRTPAGGNYTPDVWEVPGSPPQGSARQYVTDAAWRHKVTLDGPDWEFGYATGYADTPETNAYTTPVPSVAYNNWSPYIIADQAGTPATIPFSDNTYATIVDGVVSVTERVVKLSDL